MAYPFFAGAEAPVPARAPEVRL